MSTEQSPAEQANDSYIVRFVQRGTNEQGAVIGGVTYEQAVELAETHSTERTAVLVARLL